MGVIVCRMAGRGTRAARVTGGLLAVAAVVVRFAAGAMHFAERLVGVLVHDTPVVKS
jgi:hypothetical protein